MMATRNIFEEVESREAQAAAQPAARADDRLGARRAIRGWLILLGVLVTAMILVGGLTRLTDSGLSITEWRPVTGALPPLTEVEWLVEFDKYRQIPEYQLQNAGMSLAEFKVIYWWEWGHRQLGRVVGLVWAVGFLWFLVRRRIPAGWTGRLLLLGVLGGVQGAIGWWMVSSGLTGTMLDVASYRLATHLGLAFVILSLITWFVLQLSQPQMQLLQARRRRAGLGAASGLIVALLLAQVITGAFVAGIDAGLAYNTWPLMGGRLIPPEVLTAGAGFLDSQGAVQFLHRMWGYLVFLAVLIVWAVSRRHAVTAVRRAFDWVAVGVLGQAVLGIGVVLYFAPLPLALAHQAGAVLLLVLALRARHLALYPPEQRIARG
ncbi:MAG: COX15/CtaA family protein [Pseudomonadota bacterium]